MSRALPLVGVRVALAVSAAASEVPRTCVWLLPCEFAGVKLELSEPSLVQARIREARTAEVSRRVRMGGEEGAARR